ncbi:hypothetical protein [Rhodopseudomonas sp. WA056]|uniref:hypothetical protein n=1 Tax=Rhodopseudomonas sp. WA056 TaxID=2269367 RepID=UPI0013DEDE31|nr:hypothetical protein [Rhodopseudomonas sp. WA056]
MSYIDKGADYGRAPVQRQQDTLCAANDVDRAQKMLLILPVRVLAQEVSQDANRQFNT